MPFFNDEREVYEHLGRLFQELATDPPLSAQLTKANTIVQYRYRDPEAQITVKLLDGEATQVDLGPSELEPEVVLSMDADTAHRFWLGNVNITVALAKGQMKARGPVAKILKLVPLIKPAFSRYRTQLEGSGRSDLAGV